ncbi:MAG: InlB B-repeat-containing protein [Christensenellales bacterium]
MKRKIGFVIVVCLLLIALTLTLVACDKEDDDKSYNIQFTVDGTVNTITVKNGDVYSTDILPEKYGYDFMGYYDAETGGTQYINAQGSAVSAYTDKKNVILFPQFKAKDYVLTLDYQGAEVTGARSVTVSYDGKISDLPLNLQIENKDFMGWFTEPNREGVQVADEYGVLPSMEILNQKNYDIPEDGNRISLYAGFRGTLKTLTLYFNNYSYPEELKVEYGTDISQVIPETRVDGKAVLKWTKTNGSSEAYIGKVTSDMVLYALEYAPIIEFEALGGKSVAAIVAKTGSAISLPVTTKKDYGFGGWKNSNGDTVNYTSMPSESMTLTAIWKPMLIFDERGGAEVSDVCQNAGTAISLPQSEKAGYIFAGWYTEKGEAFNETAMPSESITLKAKYYKIVTKKIILVASNSTIICDNTSERSSRRKIINMEDIYNGIPTTIKIKVHCITYHKRDNVKNYLCFYKSADISSSSLIKTFSFDVSTVERDFEFEFDMELNDKVVYMYYYTSYYDLWSSSQGYFSDLYLNIEYADTSTLY